MATCQDQKAALKLCCIKDLSLTSDKKIIEKVLEEEGDINYAIPIDSPYRFHKPDYIGYTALHFACEIGNIDLLSNLLHHGADYTKKNREGESIVHMLVAKFFDYKLKEPWDNELINAVLSAHINTKNNSNPCNKYGLSHFHVACLASNPAAVQFFLENNVSVDESVNENSNFCPGYTPLHFAAFSTNAKAAELLLSHGANIYIRNTKHLSPLHLLIECRMNMCDTLENERLRKPIEENEKIINMLLEKRGTNNNFLDSIGLCNFHVACLLQDTSLMENLLNQAPNLNQCVNIDSEFWPGYTALHFASYASIQTVGVLVENGADLAARDSKGLTPLDICFIRYKLENVCNVISLNERCSNLFFSDGATNLLSFLRALESLDQLMTFMNEPRRDISICLPMDSPLWPGSTALHLAIICSPDFKHMSEDRSLTESMDIIIFFLLNGADLSKQDSRGQTALHLAFRLNKDSVWNTIFQYCSEIPNVHDEYNLSHLHIACTTDIKNVLKKFTLRKCDVNAAFEGPSAINTIRPGYTPLHICLTHLVDGEHLEENINILLQADVKPHMKDVEGLTPIHLLLNSHAEKVSKELLKTVKGDVVAERYGISYLHVACVLNNQSVIESLIKKRKNINLPINCTHQDSDNSLEFFLNYDKQTPVHLSPSLDMFKLFFKHGADLFVKRADGSSILSNDQFLEYFVKKAQIKTQLWKRMKKNFGWTKLHLACYLLQDIGFEDLVKARSKDINSQIFSNSPVWQRYTPLHCLLSHCDLTDKADQMTKILLANGADVTILDEEKNSPVSIVFKGSWSDKKIIDRAALLMKYHKNFNVNPINSKGISHFHIACYLNDFDVVQGFLSHGVDVNQPIDYFGNWYPGYTPLHLASKLEIVNLLIQHGGDVHVENVARRNVLAEAFYQDDFDEDVVARIIKSVADINAYNFKGETPFEILINGSISTKKLTFCIKYGFIVNSCNPVSGVGYIAKILGHNYAKERAKDIINSWVEVIMNGKSDNKMGRTTLHHLVSGERTNVSTNTLVALIEKLIKRGHDVDEQDEEGRTALHWAVKLFNQRAILALLRCGADINVLDKSGKPAIYYLSQGDSQRSEHGLLEATLNSHIRQLLTLNLDVNDVCKDYTRIPQKYTVDTADFTDSITASKEIEVGVGSIRLYDFLSENGAVLIYCSLNLLEREKIDEFFDTIKNNDKIGTIESVLMLQYRKALKRVTLLSVASNSLKFVLGFHIPVLCAENILQYLLNSELRNVIDAEY